MKLIFIRLSEILRKNIDSDNFNKKGKRKVAEHFTTNVKEDKATLTLVNIKSKGNRCLETQLWGNTGVDLQY